MSYESFLIANLKTGLELGMEPWLLPGDAYSEIDNAYLSMGVLHKRKGIELFAQLGRGTATEFDYVDTAAPGIGIVRDGGIALTRNNTVLWVRNSDIAAPLTGTLPIPVSLGTVIITLPTEVLTDDGAGHLIGNVGGVGTIDYNTGFFSITPGAFTQSTGMVDYLFCGVPGVGSFKAKVEHTWYPNLPCMGIFNYTSSSGNQALLAMNTKRVFRFNEVSKEFSDLSGADYFTGNDDDYVWMANWLNKAFICNGRNQTLIYDGNTLGLLSIDYDGDGNNDIDNIYLILPYKDRLLLLRTTEKGVLYPGRVRWTNIGKYDESNATNYIDAPTDQWIMGAAFIKNDLCVFFERSVWLLRYTGDSRIPFKWQRVASDEGLLAKMGMMDFSDEIIAIGSTRIVGTDGDSVYNIDDKIPNLILSMNQSAIPYSYATALDELNHLWISYASPGSELPDKIVALNYEEQSFSTLTLPHMVTGYFQENEDPTWDDVDLTWDEIEWAWDDRNMQAGFPLTLGGDHNGYVWKLNKGGSDNGAPIEMSVRTGRMNPFIKEGQQARLGWVDFLVDRDPLIDLIVEYFINHESQAWKTEVIKFDNGSNNSKIMVRSYVGCEADFHQIRLYNNAANQSVVLHAMIPYFERGGAIQ